MANAFSGDANCVALWRMESGALTTDSKGTNTLTDNNTVGEDAVNYKEGACSADFEFNNAEYLSILDTNLDAGFPLKNGDTDKNISVCAWFRGESFSGSSYVWNTIFQKFYLNGSNEQSFVFGIYTEPTTLHHHLGISLGFNGGSSEELQLHATDLTAQTGVWYHATATYQNSDKSFSLRLRDANGNVVGADVEGTATLDANKLNVETAPVFIGACYSLIVRYYFDGLLDEVVVFKDVITSGEATQIALGTYGAAGGLLINVHDCGDVVAIPA